MKDIELQAERKAFEAWWRGDLVDWQGHESVPALHAWEAWQARAAVEVDRAQRVPDTLCDDDLSDLAHSANQEALSFGLSHDVFLRYFKEVRRRLLASTPAQPAQQEPDCPRCNGSGEDPEGYFDPSRGPDGGTYDGPCRDCAGTGAAQHQEPPQPVERKPMTDEQAVKCIEAAGFRTWTSAHFRLVKEAERHHGIRE